MPKKQRPIPNYPDWIRKVDQNPDWFRKVDQSQNQNPDWIRKVDQNPSQSDIGQTKTGKSSIMIDPKYWTS